MATVRVKWADSLTPDVTNHKIYRDTVPATGEILLTTVGLGVGIAGYDDTTAVEGAEYKYEVQAVNPTGESTDENTDPGGNVATIIVTSVSYLLDTYSGGLVALSMRKLKSTAVNCCRIRRLDNAQTDVLLEDSGHISLTSLVSAGGDLDTWVGATGSAYIVTWYDQSGSGNDVTTATTGDQPSLVLVGVLQVKNLLATAKFNSDLMSAGAISAMDDTNSWTAYAVSNNDSSGDTVAGAVFMTGASTVRQGIFRDNRSNKTAVIVNDGTSSASALMSQVRRTTGSILQTMLCEPTQTSCWDNGAAGDQNVSKAALGVILCTNFQLGEQNGISSLSGSINELVIFSGDNTVNRLAIEADINSTYTLY